MSATKIRTSLLAAAAAVSLVALEGDGLERAARAHDGVHLPIPRLVTDGGPVVASPRIVPVVFAGDPAAAPVGDFLAKLAQSSSVSATLAEYGVGAAEVAPAVVVDEAAPAQITSVDIRAWLAAKIGTPGFPEADGRSVYVVLYPAETQVTEVFPFSSFPSCFGTGAYHDVVKTASGAQAPLVVAPHCDGFMNLSGLDEVTVTLGTELVGALTNPYPDRPAYIGANFDGSGWQLAVAGGEVAEICAYTPNGLVRPASIGYLMPRLWSNAAAREGRDPCTLGGRYFNAVPLGLGGAEVAPGWDTRAVTIPVGGEVTIPLRLVSDGHGPRTWQLSANEVWSPFITDPSAISRQLSFSFDHDTGGDGDVRLLTVKRTTPSAGDAPFVVSFAIQSTSGAETHSWIVAVDD